MVFAVSEPQTKALVSILVDISCYSFRRAYLVLILELLDMFIFNLNSSCHIAPNLMAAMWNYTVGFRSIVASIFPLVTYAFETLQFLKFILFSALEICFRSFTMENCSSYYDYLHLDMPFSVSLFFPLEIHFIIYWTPWNDNERKEINTHIQTLDTFSPNCQDQVIFLIISGSFD